MDPRKKLDRDRGAFNERNDCAVVSVAIVTGLSYRAAHEALRRAGRRARCATWPKTLFAALDNLGFEVEETRPRKDDGRMHTMNTIGGALPSGRWILFPRGHFAALVDGNVLDWSQGTKRRVRVAYRVSPRDRAESWEQIDMFGAH